MADRSRPVKLRLNGGPSVVKCASNRKYAAVQLVPDHTGKANYRPKVLKRSDSAHAMADAVRKLPGFTWVFELKHGTQLWANTQSEWMTVQSAILNHETLTEDPK